MNPIISKISFVCPVTQQRALVPLSTEEPGVPVVLSSEDDAFLGQHPEGWGALDIRFVAPNPAIAEITRQREEARADAMQRIEDSLKDPGLSKKQKAEVEAHLKDGTAARQVQEHLDLQLPLPEDQLVTLRVSWPVLGREALTTLFKLLQEKGFPLGLERVQ